ncbi:unnamed protein product [Caenorhabditis brenneri]
MEDDPEDSKSMRKAKKEEELDEDVLPANGLFNHEGHLFYHASIQQLTKAQYKRAEDHGINLRSKKRFTLEESVRIFKNWHHYATENSLHSERALDYLTAKKKDKHITQHQEDNHFWVKLCNGLPHRSGIRIKTRAQQMMTDAFMKELDWSRLEEQIQKKYCEYETYDESKMQKMQKLVEKGYSASYAAEILDLPVTKAINMTSKIKNIEGRDDQAMMNSIFDAAFHFGLDYTKLQKCVYTGDEFDLDRLRKDMKIDELSSKLQVSEQRCNALLKSLLKSILDKYQKFLKEKNSEDEAWDATLQEFTDKPPIKDDQLYKAVEVFCKYMEKEDTKLDLYRESLAKLVKSNGITGFHCFRSEFRYIRKRICEEMLRPLQKELFEHLRRDFPLQLKLHCLLWSYKRLEVWDKIVVPEGKTRYEVVLDSEISNPLASKMTIKFLKNEKVVEWIMDHRSTKHRRNSAIRRLEAGVEAFILYIYQKSSGAKFKFPANLADLVSPDITIKSILSEIVDPQNSEYLSIKHVRNIVEEASGNKILVRLKNKYIIQREKDEDPDSEEVPDVETVENLLEHSRHLTSKVRDERRKEIEDILEKADPSNIRRKFQNQEEADEIWLGEELYRQKQVMNRAAKMMEDRTVKSKEFIDTDDSSSDEERQDDVEEEEDLDDIRNPENSEGVEKESSSDEEEISMDSDEVVGNPEDSEDVDDANSVVGERDSEAPFENSGDAEIPEEDSESAPIVPEDFPSISEDVTVKKKKKKRKHQDSENVETPESAPIIPDDVESLEDAPSSSEAVTEKKKNKKQKNRNSDDVEAPVEIPPIDFEHVTNRKKKKKKRQDSENLEEVPITSEDVGAPEDVPEKHKKKKKKHQDDVEDPEYSDEVVTEKKKKKKRKHRDSEDAETMEILEDMEASEDVKPKKEKERKNKDSEEASEDVPSTSEGRKKKKNKKRRREELEEN